MGDFYDRQGRLFLPPFKPGAILSPKLHEAYAKEKLSRVKLATEASLLPGHETGDKVESFISVEQHTEVSEKQSISTTDIRVGVPEIPMDDSWLRVTRDTGIVFPSELDFKKSPTSLAVIETLANHIGIELTPEARDAEKRRGVAIVVHGPPLSGRTTQAEALGVLYGAPVLQIDKVLIKAISSASTPSGRKARECCIQAIKSQESSEVPLVPPGGKGEGGGAGGGGGGGGKKQLQASGMKDHQKDHGKDNKDHPKDAHHPSHLPEMPYTPLPFTPFDVEPHEDKEYSVLPGGGSLLPTHLPEDLIVEILTERIQSEDCQRGVILDGIESQFTTNPLITAPVILRAFNNRKHMYFVHLDLDINVIKHRLEEIEQMRILKIREEDEARRKAVRREAERIEELLHMDEDDYEALDPEQRAEIDAICLQHKRMRRKERKKQKEEKERMERERKEEEERLKEMEKSKKKGKNKQIQKLGQPTTGSGGSTANRPQTMPGPAGISAQPSRPESVSSGAGIAPGASSGVTQQTSQALGGFIATTSGVSVMSSMDSPSTMTPRHKGSKVTRKSSAKSSTLFEAEEDPAKLDRMYGRYKSIMDALKTLLEDWDRQEGVAKPKKLPESEETKPTPTRKSRAFKQQKELEAAQAAPAVPESREGLGVPFIEVRAIEGISEITRAILDSDLPTLEEILIGLGMGPDGPPIPESFTFQVCPFPLKRRVQEPPSGVYSFIATSPDDP